MSAQVELLHAQIQLLSPSERAELAHRILHTLEPEEPGAEQAWAEEIRKRVAEVRSGKAACYPEAQVMAEIEEELA